MLGRFCSQWFTNHFDRTNFFTFYCANNGLKFLREVSDTFHFGPMLASDMLEVNPQHQVDDNFSFRRSNSLFDKSACYFHYRFIKCCPSRSLTLSTQLTS